MKLYHDLPFPGFSHLKARRNMSRQRIDRIFQLVSIPAKTVLDIGCSDGAISLGMVECGASRVIGIDSNKGSIETATTVAKSLKFSTVQFLNEKVNVEWTKKTKEFDVIIWLSQWQWSVRQDGLDKSFELLYEMSRKGKIMVFESASNDGGGGIKDSTQDDIEQWLKEHTVYENIIKYPPLDGCNWKGGTRNIFICTKPFLKSSRNRGNLSVVTERVARDKIRKTYINGTRLKELEVKALKRLQGFEHFPKLLEDGDDYIVMSYVGKRSNVKKNMKAQAIEILKKLQEVNVVHNDITLKNLLAKNGQLYLIDFDRCLLDGKIDRWRQRAKSTYTDAQAIETIFNDHETIS